MIELKGAEKRHIELIKSEKDIDSIIKKGGEAAKRTLYVINEFREIMQEFSKFRYNIERQNSLLKLESDSLKTKDMAEAEKSAMRIKESFEEEKKFYWYLARKEGQERVEVLKAFGEMKDVTLLGKVAKEMAKSGQGLTKVREQMYADFEALESLKRMMKEKKLDQNLIDEINKFQRQIEENKDNLHTERERVKEAENLIHKINQEMGEIKEIKDEKDVEKKKSGISSGIKKAGSMAGMIWRRVKKLSESQEKTERLKKRIIEWLKNRGLIEEKKK